MREDLKELFKGAFRSGIKRVTVTMEPKGTRQKKGPVFHVLFKDTSLLHVGEDLTSAHALQSARESPPASIRTRRTTRRS